MFYFAYRAALLHLVIGLAVLGYMFLGRAAPPATPSRCELFESGGAYWHMVDLLWIVLFPLLYLVN